MKGILKKTVSSVSRLFAKDGEENGADAEVTQDATPSRPPVKRRRRRPDRPRIDPQSVNDQMNQILRQMVDKHGSAVAGRVQILRFDELLSSVGPKRAERLENAIEGIARKYIGQGDILRPMGNGVFITIFGGISQTEAEVKCAMIRDDVNQFADGNPHLKGQLTVSTVVASVDGSLDFEDLPSLDDVFERLSTEQGTSSEASGPPEKENPSAPDDANPEEPITSELLSDWDSWLDPEAGAGEPVVTGQGPTEPDRSNYDDPKWRDIPYGGDLQGGAEASGASELVDVATLRGQFAEAEMVARPVWNLDRKIVAAVSCIPVKRRPGQSAPLVGDAIVGANPAGVVTLSLDRLAVKWAEQHAAQASDRMAIIPFHFLSLASMRNRSLLFNACLEHLSEVRSRTIAEVMFPDDIHLTAVEDVVRLSAPFVGGVAVCCDLRWRFFSNLKGFGVKWVGFSLAGVEHAEEEVIDAMANFASGASRAGLVSFAKNLPTRNLIMAAAAVGIQNVFAAPDPGLGAHLGDVQFDTDDLYGGHG